MSALQKKAAPKVWFLAALHGLRRTRTLQVLYILYPYRGPVSVSSWGRSVLGPTATSVRDTTDSAETIYEVSCTVFKTRSPDPADEQRSDLFQEHLPPRVQFFRMVSDGGAFRIPSCRSTRALEPLSRVTPGSGSPVKDNRQLILCPSFYLGTTSGEAGEPETHSSRWRVQM